MAGVAQRGQDGQTACRRHSDGRFPRREHPMASQMIGRDRTWKLVSTGTGMLSGLLAGNLRRRGYEVVRKDAAAASPFDPAKPGFSWPDALLWAAAAGI